MWRIICRPEGKNPGCLDPGSEEDKNMGAMIVLLTSDMNADEQEIARVGWIRRNTRNPDVTLEDMLPRVLDTARLVATTLNDLNTLESDACGSTQACQGVPL